MWASAAALVAAPSREVKKTVEDELLEAAAAAAAGAAPAPTNPKEAKSPAPCLPAKKHSRLPTATAQSSGCVQKASSAAAAPPPPRLSLLAALAAALAPAAASAHCHSGSGPSKDPPRQNPAFKDEAESDFFFFERTFTPMPSGTPSRHSPSYRPPLGKA